MEELHHLKNPLVPQYRLKLGSSDMHAHMEEYFFSKYEIRRQKVRKTTSAN
jgi:hypothetical protein